MENSNDIKFLSKCPVCSKQLIAKKLTCESCGIELLGSFQIGKFDFFSDEEMSFLKCFLANDGNLAKTQNDIGLNYYQAKEKLNRIKAKLCCEKTIDDKEEFDMSKCEIKPEDSKVVKAIKSRIIESQGAAYLPMLKGGDIKFYLAPDNTGLISSTLPNVILKWEVFDAIVKKANELGGTMLKGDSAAQSGARVGSALLPLDTIDAFISLKFFNSNIGDKILRRSTYFSAVLAWADIAYNCKSNGEGGYIQIKHNYRDFI